MKKNIRPTFFALPLGISDLKFKNNNSTIIMLGRLYCLWYERKQNICYKGISENEIPFLMK